MADDDWPKVFFMKLANPDWPMLTVTSVVPESGAELPLTSQINMNAGTMVIKINVVRLFISLYKKGFWAALRLA